MRRHIKAIGLYLAAAAAACAVVSAAAPASASVTPPRPSGYAQSASVTLSGGMVPGAPDGAQPAPAAIPSCLSIVYNGNAGGIYVQTNLASGYLAWGIYMYVAALNAGPWTVSVLVNGKQVDYKSQLYAPHGSLPPKIAKKGSLFSLSAVHYSTVSKLWYYSVPNQCRIP
jgi:hypothetical protein